MIETLGPLGHGFSDRLTLMNIFCAVTDCLLRLLIGVLLGLGISGTVVILLPVTFGMRPLSVLIMIPRVYFDSQYGSTITSILVNIPDEVTSIVTCSDGHPLAKQGKGGKTLSVVTVSSFYGGTISLIGPTFVASAPARVALSFEKIELFTIVVFGLVLLTTVSRRDQLKDLVMVCPGVILGYVGLDDPYGTLRLAYGAMDPYKGISSVTFTMGVHGITELTSAICIPENQGEVVDLNLREQFPNKEGPRQICKTIGRRGIMGFGVDLVPGADSILATSFAYGMKRSLSKHPDIPETGFLGGVAASEAANSATMYMGTAPLLSLGIPFISSIAPLMGAFIVHGITPDPVFASEHPGLFWGLIVNMSIDNIVLPIISLPLIGVWASLPKMGFTVLMPLITFIALAGSYAINNSVLGMGVMMICGTFGFFLNACGYNMAAPTTGPFPSPTLENSFLGITTLYKGNLLAALMGRPTAATILPIAMIVLVYSTVKNLIQLFRK